jgi:hypothetical protein
MGAHSQGLKSLAISFTTTGDNVVIPAIAGATIMVYGILFTVAGATNITFKDGSTALSGAMVFAVAGQGLTLYINEEPYFVCQPGDTFVMNQSGAVQTSGTVYYQQGG